MTIGRLVVPCPNGELRSIQVCTCELDRGGGLAKPGQTTLERLQRKRLIAMRIAQARRDVNDLRQSFGLLRRVFLFRLAQLGDPQPIAARVDDAETRTVPYFLRGRVMRGMPTTGNLPCVFRNPAAKSR